MQYGDIPPCRYYELIVHEALQQANSKNCRAAIYMNKMLGHGEENSEADILCIGEKKGIPFVIIIECKNLKYPKQGEAIPYFGKDMTRETLLISLKKKRTDAYLNCHIENVVVLGVFNDDELKLDKIANGVHIVGNKFEFQRGSFEFPQDMSDFNYAWNELSRGMKALSPAHDAIQSIIGLPLHPWHRQNRECQFDQDNPEAVSQNYDSSKPIRNIWEEDHDGWPEDY